MNFLKGGKDRNGAERMDEAETPGRGSMRKSKTGLLSRFLSEESKKTVSKEFSDMVKNGKQYREFVTDTKRYKPLFDFVEDFEKNNTVSIRVREKDTKKIDDFIQKNGVEEQGIIKTLIPFEMFEINTNNYRLYIGKAPESVVKVSGIENALEYSFRLVYVSKNREKVEFSVISIDDTVCFEYYENPKEGFHQVFPYIYFAKRIMFYILNQKKTIIRIGGSKENNQLEDSPERKSTKIKKKTHYISIDEAVEYSQSITGNGRKIQAECYGVRGNYRHYKTGKVVFIKPYKKGWNRDSAKSAQQRYSL